MSLIPLYSLAGEQIKGTFVFEDITGLDETYPQHYGMPTSALDWTYNPFIALFFTLYADKTFYLEGASPKSSKYLSVYVYEEIIKNDSQVIINGRDNLKDNPRAIAQEGTFMYFKSPCSFYLLRNRFPSLEDYEYNMKNEYEKKVFELKKLSLLRSEKNINFISELLNDYEINEEKLLLPKIN